METANGSHLSREVSVLAAWLRSHAQEWAQRYLPHMNSRSDEDRGPEDYARDDREVMRILRQLIARPSGNNYNEGGGDKRTLNWILGVLSLLLVGAVGGGVSLYGKVSSLETRVSEWQRAVALESAETRRRLERLEGRP